MFAPNVSSIDSLCTPQDSGYGCLPNLKISTNSSSQSSDSGENKYLEIDDVRITPAMTVFRDAFVGRKFNQKLVIQNCGKHAAVIRICSPKPYAFMIETNLRGQYLSSGLSIVKNISYTHLHHNVATLAYFEIYINKHYVKYNIAVTLSAALIRAEPQYVDFGTINADSSPMSKTITIINDGSEESRFAMDLGSNSLQLLVQPMRGLIEPKSSITVRIEILSHKEGAFMEEMWVKCETPFRVPISVNFITPKLSVFCSNGTPEFIFIDYPRTYYGTSYTKFLVIKNDCATGKMFCIMAEVGNKLMTLQEARKERQDFKCFHISPIEGRLQPHEGRIVEIIFTPQKYTKTGDPEYHEDYAICFIRIIQVNRRDHDIIVFQDTQMEPDIPILTSQENMYDSIAVSVDEARNYTSLKSSSRLTSNINRNERDENKIRRICLHGQCERIDICIRPNSLHLTNLSLNQQENRELLLINNSKYLKVFFRYKKCANIELNPNVVVLKPLEKLEINVQINPRKIGPVQTNIVFDILYPNLPENVNAIIGNSSVPTNYNVSVVTSLPQPKFNMGITPQITNEVGFLTDDVRFNTMIKKPTAAIVNESRKYGGGGDLIAFPNDRPTSLRPWKSAVQCKTIFAGIPRPMTDEDEYTLSETERRIKKMLVAHYNEYIRRKQIVKGTENMTKCSPDYDIGDNRNLLMQKPKFKCMVMKPLKEKSPSFISMTPTQLYKLKAYPLIMDFEKVATKSRVSEWLQLKNENDMSIRIYMECRHKSINYGGGPRVVIPANSEVHVEITYIATNLGRYNIPIYVTINENHFFVLTVLVEVVSKFVRINVDKIEFVSDELEPKFIEIFNPLNAPVSFEWEVPNSCFLLQPLSGYIGATRTCVCVVTYTPHPTAATQTDFILILENGSNITIPVYVMLKEPNVVLQSKEFLIECIPLNIPIKRKFILRNNSFETISVSVLEPEPALGLKISPRGCTVHGKGDLTLSIELKIKAYVNFKCVIKLILQRVYEKEINILGEVDFPYIAFLPKELNFHKLIVNSTRHLALCVVNQSNSLTKLHFNFEEFPDFAISDSVDRIEPNITKKDIVLKQNERKLLFISYVPIDVAYYNFFLPVTINNIIGPPRKDDPDSLHLDKYLGEAEMIYVNNNDAIPSKLSKPLVGIQVAGTATALVLTISRSNFDFNYFPNKHYHSVNKHELRFANVSNDQIEICIRTDDLEDIFSITPPCGRDTKEYQSSYVCSLEPNETIIYKIIFHPQVSGVYNIQVPVYVRNQLKGSPFNYLSLRGIYPATSIEIDEPIIYLEPVPIGCFSNKTIELKTLFHKQGCFIKANVDSENLVANFIDGRDVLTENVFSHLRVTISFSSMTSAKGEGIISFFCQCPARCEILVKFGSENSIATTHAFLHTNGFKDIENVFSDYMLQLNCQSEKSSTIKSYGLSGSQTGSVVTPVIEIGAYENAVNLNETTFPFFPDDDDESRYAEHMRTTLKTLENWMYKQCFCSKQFFSIPNGIAAYPVEFDFEKEKKAKSFNSDKDKGPIFVLPFVKLLKLVAGPAVGDQIIEGSLPSENLERIGYIYYQYDNILNILMTNGAHLPHVQAEHMLDYKDYVEYMESIYPQCRVPPNNTNPPIFDENSFYLTAKQSWMDVVLQTFKIFILRRVRLPAKNTKPIKYSVSKNISASTFRKGSSSIKSAQILELNSFLKLFEQTTLPQNNIYNNSELILLSWLEYHFDHQREKLWNDVAKCKIAHRHIQHFDKDLSDSAVLAAATATYCPYLAYSFRDFYINPNTYEKKFYNAYRLIEVWRLVNSSFDIHPDQIVNPDAVQMLLLVTYLYEFLPNLLPKETLTITAKHTKTIQETITIKNFSMNLIAYKIKFFTTGMQYFETDTDTLVIPPNKEGSLNLTFHARKLARVHSTLLLCGDTPGYNYAKSIAFHLEGIPDVSYVNSTLKLKSHLYDVYPVPLTFFSPYKVEATYDVFCYFFVPEHIDDLYPLPKSWKEFKIQKLPRRIYNRSTVVSFDHRGVGKTVATVCSLTPISREYLTYFFNDDVGDFSAKLIMSVDRKISEHESIFVRLPRSLASLVCNCKKSKTATKSFGLKCPRELGVDIPRRNNLMWACIQKMFFESLDVGDIPFWTKYLGTSAGNHLFKYMFDTGRSTAPRDIAHIFNKTVTYKVIPEGKPAGQVTLPNLITVDDVLTEGYFTLPIHLQKNKICDFFFNMISEDETEIRYYKVEFLPEI